MLAEPRGQRLASLDQQTVMESQASVHSLAPGLTWMAHLLVLLLLQLLLVKQQ